MKHSASMSSMHTEHTSSVETDKKTTRATLRRMIALFRPYSVPLGIVAGATILATAADSVEPLLLARLFNDALEKHDLHLFVVLIAVMAALPIFVGLVGVGQNLHQQRCRAASDARLTQSAARAHASHVDGFFTSNRSGEVVPRLSSDIAGVESILTDTFRHSISIFASMAGAIIAMVILSPLLTVISLCLLPLFILITFRVGAVRRATAKQTRESLAALTSLTQESRSINWALLAKTFGRQEFLQRRFERESQS